MKLLIEFPLHIVKTYHGPGNLDETLDEHISYLIGKYCYDHQLTFRIHEIEFVDAQPKVHDELVRYWVELGVNPDQFDTRWISGELISAGYEKGLTIKTENGSTLHGDAYSPDIDFRRMLKQKTN